jgi:hypothetical protein
MSKDLDILSGIKKGAKMKIILDLCGGTGSWSKPYRDNGYDVRLVTLPDNDVRTYIPPDNVYGILAAPVCTMFSLARTRAKTPRDFRKGMELVIACLNIVWECRYKNKLAFWCMENPMGYLRQFLGKPVFTFDPCDFGDPYTKKTDLWGYFNIPKKRPVNLTEEQKQRCKVNNRKLPSIFDFTGSKQSAKRAITPYGFAKAFYKANK